MACALGLAALIWPQPAAAPPDPTAGSPPPLDAPLVRSPLVPPLVLNGGFGEYRSNHFHAGLDLGTGGRVGRPVVAPLPGWIERVRASGVGYGRSLYLRTTDGRTLVFGHLDAFAPPIAGYVAAMQDSTGQYEQDLWPEARRFFVTAGQRIAWTGESGSGGPHLHFEIRRGDMAYHPLRAGLSLSDTRTPALTSLTLEPLDDASYVERGAAPHTITLGAARETVLVEGRVRAIVGARDGVWQGVDRMVPWSTALEFAGERVECRFDSVSWATDMVESDYVYDAGRVVGDKGIVLWAPAGFRPRVLITSAPPGADAGTIVVRPGDPPRVLTLTAQDLAGATVVREVLLRAPGPGETGPDTAAVGGRAEPDSARWFELAALPGNHLRVTFRGAPAGSRGVTIAGRPASMRRGEWTAVVVLPQRSAVDVPLRGRDATGGRWERALAAARRDEPAGRPGQARGVALDGALPKGAPFESALVLARWSDLPTGPARELVPRSEVLQLLPSTLRLRRGVRIEWSGVDPKQRDVGLYADDGDGWGWLSTSLDSTAGRRTGETRHLGRFAVFADTVAPRILLRRPPARVIAGPYSRWALAARLTDEGSGVAARTTWFEVDGRRVPSEWDAEEGLLRWRPPRAPGKGSHRYAVVATDRAGNERRALGRFVMP